jgi:hypothetical protein
MGVGEATTVAFDGKSHRLNDQHGRTILENLSENGRLVLHRNGSGGGAGVALHFGDDVVLGFGNAEGREPDRDSGILWSTGDASNHAMVLFVGQSNQVLHIVEHNDRALDFNVSANALDPELIIHSSTTPATDYLSIGAHNGTQATIDVAGGTKLIFALGGTAYVTLDTTATVFNESGAAVSFRFEGDTSIDLLFLDGAADMVKIGAETAHATTPGTLGLSLFEGTAPAGSLANGATLFADVVTSDEVLRGIDSAGNVTTI